MSEPKAQLVDPQGNMNLPGMNATGVITATSFDGAGGVVTGLTGSPNLNVGVVTATSFVGDGTGHAANLTGTPNLNLGLTTATSFVGDAVGKAAGLTGTPNLNVGLITATGFTADIKGNVTGNITGNVTGNIVGDVTGNITGLASSITSGNSLGVGVCTAIQYHGDGSALTGAGSSAYIAQEVTASGDETIIDLSYGNVIYYKGQADTTVGFASTSPAEQITIVRDVDPSYSISYSTGGVDFDANGDFLSLASTSDFDFGSTGDFTIELWAKVDGFSNSPYFFDFRDAGNDTGTTNRIVWYFNGDSGKTIFWKNGSAQITAINGVTTGTWSHYALVRKDQNTTMYINGLSQGSISDSTDYGSGGSPLVIGQRQGSYAGQSFDGVLSNVRIVKGTAVYTSNFVPPSAALTNITNTKLLCCQSDSSTTTAAVTPGTITANGDPTAGAQTISTSGSLNATITWPSTVKWNNDTTPTLVNTGAPGAFQIFHFTTVDTGLNYNAWEEMQSDPAIYNLWAWGYNSYGGLGQNARTSRSSPVQVGSDQAWTFAGEVPHSDVSLGAVKNDGTLWMWGYNNRGSMGNNTSTAEISSPTQIPGTTWSQFAVMGNDTVMTTKTDGTLWMWGFNYYGKLGQNIGGEDNGRVSSPTQVGTDTTWGTAVNQAALGTGQAMAVKGDGSLWGWGMNEYGQLGTGNKTSRSSPTQVGTDTTWSEVSSGNHFCMATKTDGTLWSWGINDDGQLAHNNDDTPTRLSSPKQVGTDTTWYKARCTAGMAFMSKTDGTLWGVGSSFHGTIANSRTSRSSPIQVPGSWDKDQFQLGGGNIVALKDDGTMWSWGRNYQGKLGQNTPQPSERSSPVQVGTDTTWKAIGGGGGYVTLALKG